MDGRNVFVRLWFGLAVLIGGEVVLMGGLVKLAVATRNCGDDTARFEEGTLKIFYKEFDGVFSSVAHFFITEENAQNLYESLKKHFEGGAKV